MDTLTQDLRYALRRLARNPGFTLVAIVTLALGIGANSAIFSVVNSVLLRQLPFADSDRLVLLYTSYPEDDYRYPLSAPDFMSLHDDAGSLSAVAAVGAETRTVTGSGEPTRVATGSVSESFFAAMGVAPVIGRVFHPDENRPGEGQVAVLSHAYWRQAFGGEADALGQIVTLNGVPHSIVGVLPPEFDFPDGREIYLPLAYNSTFNSATAEGRRAEYLTTVGRIRDGFNYEQVAAEVGQISARLQSEFPETNSANISLSITPLRAELLGGVRAPLLVLLGAVGLVLLIACVNVANLLLARAAARSGEMAVRTALGAGRPRLVRQLLTESLVLGIAGGVAGLLVAFGGTRLLVAARPEGIPRLASVGIDPTVISFTAVVAIGTSLLFGLVPAIQVTRSPVQGSLREGGRGGTPGRDAQRFRRGLVVSEIALALMLLIGAGLLMRSFVRLTAVDPGFRTERLLTFALSLPAASYTDGASVRHFYSQALERVGSLPGVEAIGAGSETPLGGTGNILGFAIENREPPQPGFVMDAAAMAVTPGYFSTFGIPLLDGRTIDARDDSLTPDVVVVNEAFVGRYFPDENPVGRRISFDGEAWRVIVGVVGDVPQYGLDRDIRPALYASHEQFTTRSLVLAARTRGEPTGVAWAIRSEIAALDPNLPIERFVTGEEIIAASVAGPRFYTVLLGIFAAVALSLAGIGIFGVMSYLVAQRTREIGVRIALGADTGRMLRLITTRTLTLAAIGIATGVLAAALVTRVLSGMLFGIGTLDPVTYASAAMILMAVAGLAGYLPARRAARVDPAVALRAD
jgi:putative ABC transport system permease protein